MMKLTIIVIPVVLVQSFSLPFDIRIKYFRTDEAANGLKYYALDFPGLIDKHGRTVEWHNVTTEDGYTLSLFRVPPNTDSYKNANKTTSSRVFYLQHCLGGTADIYILFGPGRSLVYSLSDAGYDVWIGNLRGTPYSRNHTKYSPDDSEFWNFSMDEYALQDLPVMLDYVIDKTGQRQLSYIGHSLGSTLILMLLADRPEYNDKLNVVIHFAAVSYWKTWNLVRFIMVIPALLLQVFIPGGAVEFLPNTTIGPVIFRYFCLLNYVTARMCGTVESILVGEDRDQFDISEEQVHLLQYYPAGISEKVLQHYYQQLLWGDFGHYQYITSGSNYAAYGQRQAPQYNLTNIRAPTMIYAGLNDPIATIENTENLISKFNKDLKVQYNIIPYRQFTHGDYILARDVEELLYKPMLKSLEHFFKSQEQTRVD